MQMEISSLQKDVLKFLIK